MNNQEILDNAPKGATHVEIFTQIKQFPYYYRREFKGWCNKFVYDWWDRDNKQWLNSSTPTGDMRSLADIKALVAKDKKIEELVRFISENTPLLSYLAIETVSSSVDGDPLFRFKDWLAKHNLEQQAKGAEYIIESVLGEPETLTSDALSIRYEFLDRLKQLREQAKGGAN